MSDWWAADPVASDGATGGPLRLTVTPQAAPFQNAISSVESGGRYNAVGPETGKGRALGKYQVMDFNVGPWSEEVLGRRLSPQEFLNSREAQDAVFNAKFGNYVKKYGPEGAARAWFAGEGGMNNPNAKDVLGTTVADYSKKFTNALGTPAAPQPQAQAASVGQWWANDPVANQQPQPTAPQAPAPSVAERFAPVGSAPLGNRPALETGLNAAANRMRSSPVTTSPGQQLAIDYANQGSAAGQGTSPIIAAQAPNLISSEVHQSDSGELLYRDRNGQMVPTDQNKHVILRDPADNTLKVYARTPGTDEGRLSAAGRLLSTGAAAGAPTARPAIPVPSQTIVPKASDIVATSKPYYRAFTQGTENIEIPPQTGVDLAERLRGALNKSHFIEEQAPQVYAAVRILEKGEPLSIAELQNIKKVVGRSFGSSDKTVRDAAAVVSRELVKIISEVAPEAGKNLKTADAIHSTAMAVQDLQRKSGVADLRAGRAGYGGNAVNSMRQVLSPVVEAAEKGKVTGFQPGEIAAIRDIVLGTPATNALRLVGQVSPTSGLGLIRATGAGGTAMFAGASGGTALAIPAIGAAANKLATILTGRQIDRLKELVAKRSPAYAEAVERAVKRYEQAQAELASNPSPGKLAAYASASRALASGLTRDGIKVTSGDLMRSIQGPVKSAAEDEQP